MAKQNRLPNDLLRIEGQLQEVLQPISPRTEFVDDLRSRLDQAMIKKTTTKRVKVGLLVAGGIVGLAVMVISIIRSLTDRDNIFQAISNGFARLRKREQAVSV